MSLDPSPGACEAWGVKSGTGATLALTAAIVFGGCRCGRDGGSADAGTSTSAPSVDELPAAGAATLSAPIAAAQLETERVVVAGLDAAAKGLRVQLLSGKTVEKERVVLGDVAWSNDADLKVVAGHGISITWRGLRGGRLVRQLVTLDPNLEPKGDPVDVPAASCATKEALWFTDGTKASVRPWNGAPHTVALPKEKEASLLCGATTAYAVIEDDDKTSLTVLGAAGGATRGATHVVVREADFGEDEQRELSEFTVGDDVGVVRLSRSGAIAVRELKGGALGPLSKLTTYIGQDDDVVAVDASTSEIVIVYTQDVADGGTSGSDAAPCTRVLGLRVNRTTLEESKVVLGEARCGIEVGPFFTGAFGEGVKVAWTERASTIGRARAPIVGFAHAHVVLGKAPSVARVEQPADALVDAGCSAKTSKCVAVALARTPGADVMLPGFAKVLLY